MEAHRHFGKLGIGGSRGQSSRKNSILIALLSAVLAAALIYLFVTHYKKNTAQPTAPLEVTVWVATRTIPQGTPESAIASAGDFKAIQVPATQAVVGAITDPSVVAGQATSTAIAKRQQVTASDFTRTPAVLAADLTQNQRAVAFSLDTEHGLTTWLAAGDTVDVMVVNGATHKTELVDQNVTVLENSQGLVVLKLTDKQALLVTAATTNGGLWLSLRPALGATNSVPVYSVGS
jgi:Flp pilus assembly protein CpaB